MSDNGNKCCAFCGSSEGFEDACKFSIEKAKIEIEKEKNEIGKKIVFLGTVLVSVVFFISFIFVAVIYLGLDGMKMQISRMIDKCSKGGLDAAISHLFGRR